MKVVMTGGGSGGHISPILAVAHEVKRIDTNAEIVYIGQRGDRFADIVADDPVINEAHVISAGKFRRYHGEGLKQFLDVQTLWLNMRDAARVAKGLFESIALLGRLRPDVVFCKGGFVSVPVGLAAAIRRIPYVTHDSDAIPGLANRIIARWATRHAVALDPALYPYPSKQTVNVGVPVRPVYQKVTTADQHKLKASLGIPKNAPVLLVTGGGLGAARLNRATVQIAPRLLSDQPDAVIIHTTGAAHETVVNEAYDEVLDPKQRARVRVIGYSTELHTFSAAADLIVARGGATNFAEFAAQAKACIIVPNPFLTGGHQLKNAAAYAAKGAIVLLDEAKAVHNPEVLRVSIEKLLADPAKRRELEETISTFARPGAASDLAKVIVEAAHVPEEHQ